MHPIEQESSEHNNQDLTDDSDDEDSLDLELAANMPTLALRRAAPNIELLSLRRSDTTQYENSMRPSQIANLLDTSRESEMMDSPQKSDHSQQ